MMEYLSEIISMIGGIVTSIALPLLGVFLFYESKKRSESAKAKAAEAAAKEAEAQARQAEENNITSYAQEWKSLYEQRDKRVNELNAKIDQLYQEKETDRQRIRSMQEENTRLKLDGVTYRCEKLDCGLRVPPNAYTPKIKN